MFTRHNYSCRNIVEAKQGRDVAVPVCAWESLNGRFSCDNFVIDVNRILRSVSLLEFCRSIVNGWWSLPPSARLESSRMKLIKTSQLSQRQFWCKSQASRNRRSALSSICKLCCSLRVKIFQDFIKSSRAESEGLAESRSKSAAVVIRVPFRLRALLFRRVQDCKLLSECLSFHHLNSFMLVCCAIAETNRERRGGSRCSLGWWFNEISLEASSTLNWEKSGLRRTSTERAH